MYSLVCTTVPSVSTAAVTLLLLPFVGLGLFLLRRNYQRGGRSRNLANGLARKMAERAGVSGGGGQFPSLQKGPEGVLSSLLSVMFKVGHRGMAHVEKLRRYALLLLYSSIYHTCFCEVRADRAKLFFALFFAVWFV